MRELISIKFARLKAAIKGARQNDADLLLADLRSQRLSGKADALLQLMKHLYAERFGDEAPDSHSVIDNVPDICCGIYNLFPDTTRLRRAEGGLRLQKSLCPDKEDEKLRTELSVPLVTVITVVFNNAATIEGCIKSVLSQTYKNIEYIIIDGASTDGTLDVIESYAADVEYYVSEPDKGLYDAMNKGLSLAKGEYIGFLNADDVYFSDAVALSIQHIQKHSLDLSYAGFYYAGDGGEIVVADEGRSWDDSLFILGIPGGHETFFVHRDCYASIGGYDLQYSIVADYDWIIRAYRNGFKARPLRRTILVMASGGASFSEVTEKNENKKLLSKCFASLGDDWLEYLYSLKYYRNWHGLERDPDQLMDRVAAAWHISPSFHAALFLTVDFLKLWPSGQIMPREKHRPDRLKICIALTYLTNASGGAERIAIDSANALARMGHAVTIVLCHGVAGETYYAIDAEVAVIDLAAHPYKAQYLALESDIDLSMERWGGREYPELGFEPNEDDFRKFASSHHFWRARLYKGFLDQHEFDVVISHMPSTYPYVLLGRSGFDKTLHIAALHNAPKFKFYSDLYPAENHMERYMRLVTLELADKISVLFPEFVRQMPQALRDRCFVLPNFITPALKPEDGAGKRSSGLRKIITAGRLVAQKDHETLIRAYVLFRNRFPDWGLEIYGEGPLRNELESLCMELGLIPSEIIKGVRKKLASIYSGADIFAFPSLFEGFGLTVVEAMKFGLPSVAFADCEGVRNLIRHEVDGLLVSGQNRVDALAEGLIALAENEALANRLGCNAKKRSTEYSLNSHIQTLLEIIYHARSTPFLSITKPQTEKLKVAILTTYTEGGAGIAACRLRSALVASGHDARLISFSDESARGDYRLRLGEHARAIYPACRDVASDAHRKNGGTLVSPSYPGVGFEQLAFLKHFDVINLHWVQTFITNEAVSFLQSLRRPIVWTLHDMNPFTGACHYSNGCIEYADQCNGCPQIKDTLAELPAAVLAAKKAHWSEDINVVTPSRWLSECARAGRVFCRNPIHVIPNAVDTDVFRPMDRQKARLRYGIPIDKNVLLFTCHSHKERRKGFRELVELSEELAKVSRDNNYHVLLFGEPSSELEALALEYTALGFISDESELAAAYSVADITVLPTWEDNLPNILLESIACGVPVLGFDSGGVADAIVESVTGSLVAPGDIASMVKKIDEMMSTRFRSSCRQYALRHFGYPLQAASYESLFKSLQRAQENRTSEASHPHFPFTETEAVFQKLSR